ncbi:hypothetical protein [Paenibacillus macquariensis]|uniref:Uncharacterized protein n=1 Tax=Paenibacillus macquariensis TaxID=948756 RepID=A0ABY1K440_9BACL|nr:hypothetical protein [Paenibacillus macquariensis]MEC0088937.1 hypothetical protein [Paenibacillus macquariensis]OAB31920.1 hypothetical protein PMSM_19005 [Paenibacillus macquariensis subsp. macquariensis]SIR23022.1 hypothetical protein SAMN05421578_10947 [Paenibacillus macquariensis]
MKKKLATTALGAVFALTSFGSVFAADAPAQTIGNGQQVEQGKVSKPDNFNDANKEKVKAILDQTQAGTLTKEQVKTQLQALGIDWEFDFSTARGTKVEINKVSKPDNLDDATQEKVKAILKQSQAGTLTKEQVKTQLQALGIDWEFDFSGAKDIKIETNKVSKPDNLDDATKEKVKVILNQSQAGTLTKEQVKTQLQALGIDWEFDFSGAKDIKGETNKVTKPDNLDDATQEKVKAILNQSQAGTLTKEQVKTQLRALGIDWEFDFSGAKNIKGETNKASKAE